MLIEVCPLRQVYCREQKGHISSPKLAVDLKNLYFIFIADSVFASTVNP